jgi:hypothetical protein
MHRLSIIIWHLAFRIDTLVEEGVST